MIDWEVKGHGAFLEYMRTLPEDLADAVEGAITKAVGALQRRVISKLSGPVLKVKSGDLIAAIEAGSSVVRNETSITGVVGDAGASQPVAIAAASQEFGASIPAHIVLAMNTAKLRFTINGKYHFAKEVHLPAIKIPEHSFLRSSMNEMKAGLESDITRAAQPHLRFLS